jgi:hydrogenase maturation factor HypF (carbamoyltransferase family)
MDLFGPIIEEWLMGGGNQKHVRILIKGEKVQHVGYRLLVAQMALRQRLRRFNVSNVAGGVEVLVGDTAKKIDEFYDSLKKNMPPHAVGAEVMPQERYNDTDIPTLEQYVKYDFPALHAETTSEIVNEGLVLRGVVKSLPEGIAKSLDSTLGKRLQEIADLLKKRTV